MALRQPTREDLKQLASANHFALNDDELADFDVMIPAMFATLDILDRAASPLPAAKYAERPRPLLTFLSRSLHQSEGDLREEGRMRVQNSFGCRFLAWVESGYQRPHPRRET